MTRYFILVLLEFIFIVGAVMLLFFRTSTSNHNRLLAYSQLYDDSEFEKETATVKKVLGEQVTAVPTLVMKEVIDLKTESMPTEVVFPTVVPLRDEYSIAVYGDSMVDTMGERLEYLEKKLKEKYPQTEFSLFNYGIGSQNAEEGYNRLEKSFTHQDRSYPPLPEAKPDIIIVGSYAYNPFFPFSLEKHSYYLGELLKKMRLISPKVYLLAEIAPVKNQFGSGPGGVNWDSDRSYIQSTNIISLLENSLEVANELEIAVIDAYSATRTLEDKSGDPKLVNDHDHIHPSIAGHEFMARLITKTINLD